MKYIFPLSEPYSHLNYYVTKYDGPVEFTVFSDIILNYINTCIHRWYYNSFDQKSSNLLFAGLHQYLMPNEVDDYILYLDTVFWPNINTCIIEDIYIDTMVYVTISSSKSVMFEIKPEKTRFEKVIDKLCTDVEHRIINGDYIEPILQEIYDAKRYSEKLPY